MGPRDYDDLVRITKDRKKLKRRIKREIEAASIEIIGNHSLRLQQMEDKILLIRSRCDHKLPNEAVTSWLNGRCKICGAIYHQPVSPRKFDDNG